MPLKWRNAVGVENGLTQLSIVFPTFYPRVPPYGFYMRATLPIPPKGAYYAREYRNADKKFIKNGWMWYCLYREKAWNPADYEKPMDWRKGDNLWTVFRLIEKTLNE